jgi:hypothetical protein
MKYKVFFIDGTSIESESMNSNWDSLPPIGITKLEYTVFKKTVVLSGFEEYNHQVEHALNISSGQHTITKIMLLAKKAQIVHVITIDNINTRIYPEIVEYGKEYRGKALTGWKKGLLGKIPSINMK